LSVLYPPGDQLQICGRQDFDLGPKFDGNNSAMNFRDIIAVNIVIYV
jgi:hypothetical protein